MFKIIFNLLFAIVDLISSMVVSIIHLFGQYGVQFLKYLAIIVFALVAYRVLLNVWKRWTFVREIKKIFKEKNQTVLFRRSPFRSIFDKKSEVADFSFSANGRGYCVKLLPGITKGKFIFLLPGGLVLAQGRLLRFLTRLIRRQPSKTFKIAFSGSEEHANAECILVFSPKPISVAQSELSDFKHKNDYNLDDGNAFEGVVLYSQDAFLKQLDRVLNGYTDSFQIKMHGSFS